MSNIRVVGVGIRLRTWRKVLCSRLRAVIILGVPTLMISSIAVAGNLDKVVNFHIKAQPLEKALLQFGEQAHEQIVFASKSSMGRLWTTALNGKYTGRQALMALLKGTRFEYVENGDTAEIVSNASMSSGIHRRYSERSDPAKNETEPSRGHADPEPVSPLPKSKSKTEHKAAALQQVIVTGTHIRGVSPAYPITSITRAQILKTGLATVGDALRTSPLLYSGGVNPGAIAEGNSFTGSSSGTGISTANLFGIGTGATLTLVNGHRAAGSNFETTDSLDLSMIPVVAVQRIQIQTGGSSAIYGSDAVAGVVNVILRKHYNGEETTGYVGWTQHGGGFTQRYSQLIGRTFGKGSVLVAAEFNKSDPLKADQRKISMKAGPNEWLEPAMKSESLLLNAHYSATQRLQAHAFGLYTHRTVFGSRFNSRGPSRVDEFDSNVGLRYAFPGNRAIGIDVTDSGFSQFAGITLIPCQCFNYLDREKNGMLEVAVHGSGTVLSLPVGPLSAAFGAEFRKTNFVTGGNNLGQLNGGRKIFDTYIELNIPVIRPSTSRLGLQKLTVDGAVRHSHYSDMGATTNPMIGMVYVPFRRVSIKATYSTSFHAPSLYDLHTPRAVYLIPGSTFQGASTGSQALLETGGNTRLGPETAHSFTSTIESSSSLFRATARLHASATYFFTHFNKLVAQPIRQLGLALINPVVSSFVIMNPSVSRQNEAIAGTQGLFNPYGISYDPASVTALIEDQYANVSMDDIHGVHGTLEFTWNSPLGKVSAKWTGSWLRWDRRLLANSPREAISGVLFNPPDFKMRGSLGWSRDNWGAIVFVNRIGGEQFFPGPSKPPVDVSQWTTVDGQFSYAVTQFATSGLHARVALSVINLLNADPPTAPSEAFTFAPVAFDTQNASAVGRSFSLSGDVTW